MEPGYHQPTAQPRKIRNITLKKGKCVQDIEQLKYNKVNTCIYFQANWMKGIILFLYDTFVSLESLIGLSAFIIHMVFMDDSDLYFLHTGVVLFLNFLGYGVVNILNERSRHIGDNKVNKQMTRKYWFKSEDIKEVYWQELLQGDIIEIKEDEEFPADCLILDSSELEHHCLLDTSSLDEDQVVRARHSAEDTRNISGKAVNPTYYVKQIDGALRYEPANNRFYEFEGVMKLTSFPASKRITIENIALRGYRLKNSYVYGLVLNVGNENKWLFNSSVNIGSPYFSDIKKDSVYARWQKIIMIVAVVIGLIASLIMSWVTTAQRNKSDGFNSAILGDRDNFKQFIENFFPLFLNFLSACPLSFCLIAKLVLHFYSKFIEWDVHAYTNKSIPTYVNDPRKLEALSGIEHLFASKNGVMTDNHLIFKMCSIGDIIYGTEDSNDKRTTFERVDGFNFKDHRLLDDILENNVNGVQAQELFKAIACWHSCKIRKHPSGIRKKKVFKYMNSEEETFLKAAHAFGFKFDARDKKKKSIRIVDSINEENLDYHILGFHRQEENERIGTVVQRVGTHDTPTFYVKGPLNTMLDLLREQEFEDGNLEKHIHFITQRNLKVIVIAKKNFDDDEYMEYDARKKELLSVESESREKEQEFWNDLFTDLTLVGLIALDDYIDLRVSITIDELRKNGIKFWMLTGDNQDSALANAFKQGLINHNSHPMVVSGSTDQEIQNSLKYYIKSLSQSKKNEVNLALEKGVARMIANNLNILSQK